MIFEKKRSLAFLSWILVYPVKFIHLQKKTLKYLQKINTITSTTPRFFFFRFFPFIWHIPLYIFIVFQQYSYKRGYLLKVLFFLSLFPLPPPLTPLSPSYIQDFQVQGSFPLFLFVITHKFTVGQNLTSWTQGGMIR